MPSIRNHSDSKVLYCECIKMGDLAGMKALFRRECRFHDDILEEAIRANNDSGTKVAMVGWLLNKRCKIPEDDIYYLYASAWPSKGLATLLNSRGFSIRESEFGFSRLIREISSSEEVSQEQIEIIQEYIDLGADFDGYAFSLAAERNCIPVMQLLIENGCSHEKNNFDEAFFGGAAKAMRWLFENGFSWEESELEIFVSYQPGVFISPKEKSIPPGTQVFGYAIKVTPSAWENHLKELDWLEIKEDGSLFPRKGDEGRLEDWKNEGFQIIFARDD